MTLFSTQDIDSITQRGGDWHKTAAQFDFFTKGFDKAHLSAPATLDAGIFAFDDELLEELVSDYELLIKDKKVVKFVPASGAASRMFKDLFALLENGHDPKTTLVGIEFLQKLPQFPFYKALEKGMMQKGILLHEEIENSNYQLIISYLLQEFGLNYGMLPKGLILFHRYEDGCRTAAEEHLVEAAHYARNHDDVCRLHFTVSPQHQTLFQQLVKQVLPHYEARFGVHYDIGYSVQAPETDTLAATENNEPFRDDTGQLLFRPGGHGALIYNLNALDADLVFVKNIDNVIYEPQLTDTILYKKALAAHLLQLQRRIFTSLQQLETTGDDPMLLMEIADFAENELMIPVTEQQLDAELLMEKLNRPVRVCGMVKNEGEPGGGPFWVRNRKGEVSLQIVETSQIDIQNREQQAILQSATHFNPVDMVCGLKNYKGEKFDLQAFIDPYTGFISSKSYEGRTLKAMELPGLWNGAMAQWITVFVEVPSSTFHPVKTVFDLID
jgi:hypothetical protein